MKFEQIIKERRSVRNYSTADIDDPIIQQILDEAVWAPSAGNSQPWKVKVLDRPLVDLMLDTFEDEVLELLYPTYRQKLAEHLMEKNPEGLKDIDIDQLASGNIGKHLKFHGRPSHILAVYFEKPRLLRVLRSAVPTVWRRSRSKKGLNAWKYLRLMARNVSRSFKNYNRVLTVSLSNFIYAVTLSAFEKGIGSCIVFSFNLHRDVKKFLELKSNEQLFGMVTLGRPGETTVDPAADDIGAANRKSIELEKSKGKNPA